MVLAKKSESQTNNEASVQSMINKYVKRAHESLDIMANFDQEKIDKICEAVAIAGEQNNYALAKMAVEETGRGVVEDKAIKNMFATENIWNSLRHEKTVGVISEDKEKELIKIAEPVGVIAGVTPVTNPTSTVLFKSLIALKTRNTIIFGFHPQAQRCCVKTAEIIRKAAVSAGAPKNCIQWIEKPSIEATGALMNHPEVQLILATGGPAMVKAAYSSGKPAIGVGPGNGPAYIEETADIKRAVYDIVLSKTFDNGMVCASENSVVVDSSIYEQVKKEFASWKCYFLKKNEIKPFTEKFIDPKRGTVAGPIAGKSAYEIAKLCGINVPEDTKVLIAEYKGVGKDYPLSAEKLSPVFTLYKAKNHEDALRICTELLNYGGRGHTAGIHTNNQALIKEFSIKMSACRILVNTPAALGGVGDLYNNLLPSLTLGTGTYGANALSHNVSASDLLNIKTVAMRRDNMQWVKVPKKTYFEHNAATLAGMAYGNAFLGVGHSIAHCLSSHFNLPSGVSDILVMPAVIRFNAQRPNKLAMWPHYATYRADRDYAKIAQSLGIKGTKNDELIEGLCQKISDLAHSLDISLSLKDYGISKSEFEKQLGEIAVEAYGD